MTTPWGAQWRDGSGGWRAPYPSRVATDPANWSGTPAGIAGGLLGLGVEAVPIGSGQPSLDSLRLLTLERVGRRRDPLATRSRTLTDRREAVLARAVRRAGLDALIAMGTDMYDLGRVRLAEVPTATYDDGTLLQQWRAPESDIRVAGFPEQAARAWSDTQAASSRAADACCVSTSWAGRSFVEDYGVPPDRVRVVGMGHRPRGAAHAQRDWCNPRFLMVGIDWRRKNGDAVLSAFREVRGRHPDATLDLVGAHPPVDEPGVRGHGELLREDRAAQQLLDDLFAAATAFVLPSRFDPSPIAYLEAASAGLPVIATTEGGAGELLGEAAITVHPDAHADLVRAMERLTDPATARAMGEHAAVRAADSSWRHVASRLLAALDDTGSDTGSDDVDVRAS